MPFELWRRALRQEYNLLTSSAIIRELAGVLRSVLKWPDAEIVVQLKLLVRVAAMVQPKITLHVILADPDDDRILECALAGGADLIVSGDHHLWSLETFEGIGIVRPVDFLRTLG